MEISPSEYEDFVKQWFDREFGEIQSYESEIRTRKCSYDGEYEIDIYATFSIANLKFTLLVECKRHTNKIKREVAQVLYSKMRSLGASKAVICATSGFQKGTLQYCKNHGIACIKMVPGESTFHACSKVTSIPYDPSKVWGIPKVSGWLTELDDGIERGAIVSSKERKWIQAYLRP